MALTDAKVRSAKPAAAPYKLADGEGLYLLVTTGGSRLWRMDYRFAGKRKTLALGKYPETSLAIARSEHNAAKELLESGVDPGAQRKLDKLGIKMAAENTFRLIADEWLEKIGKEDRAEVTLRKSRWFFDLLAPSIGARPIDAISTPELLGALRKIEARGKHESARRARSTAARIFRYAIVTGRAQHNPAADLGGALITPKVEHHAAIIESKKIGALLRAIDGYEGSPIVRTALRLLPLVFVRPVELRHARWADIDFAEKRWTIPAEFMKMRSPHIVPLSRQAIELIDSMRALTADGPYLFPAMHTSLRPISENTLNSALRRLGLRAMR